MIMSVALVGLMACSALTVDLGYVYMAVSQAQSLADAAALAGAGEAMNNHWEDARERIGQTIDANRRSGLSVSWNPEELTFYEPRDEVPGYRTLAVGEEAVTVTIRVEAHFMFARVLGLTTKTITRMATALRTQDDGGRGLLFAIEEDRSRIGINVSGTHILIDGPAHSNTRVDITGAWDQFTGPIEWVNRFRVQGSHTTFDVGDKEDKVRPPPFVYTPADFEPYDYIINGDYNVPSSGTVPPGVYRVSGNVHVSGSWQRLAGVTFVADGTIKMSGSNHFYTPARKGVFAYSLSTDDNGAVDISGHGPNCSGTLYAPNGNIDFSGQQMTITHGSIVGRTIDISGNDYTLRPTPSHYQEGTLVRLIK